MDYLTRIFNATEPQLISAANTLIDHAMVTAVGAHSFLCKRFEIMSSIPMEPWVTAFEIAATFSAASQLDGLGQTDELATRLQDILSSNVNERSERGLELYLSLVEFAQAHYDLLEDQDEYKDNEHMILPDLIGLWLMTKLIGSTPLAPEELHLARTAGLHAYNSYSCYWEGINQTS